jgi:dihydropteroate synthase
MVRRKLYRLDCGANTLALGRRTLVMGIVNVTPDSFSDGGKFFGFDAAVNHARRLAEEGADIIDIGGESTRPFSEPVSVEEEVERVIPVIEALVERIRVPISIDTTKAAVARRALDAGAAIINDVSALRFDPEMAALAAEMRVPVILMHMLGDPKTMQVAPVYDDVVEEIKQFLEEAVGRATSAGIAKDRLVIDPGIGFGKSVVHNLLLIDNLSAFHSIDVPILIGSSRKAFIRKLLAAESAEPIAADQPIVEVGTQAAVSAAVLAGAHIVRVHDVARTVATLKIIDACINAS